MGQDLTINIIYKITVSKKEQEECGAEEVRALLNNEVNLTKYHCKEDEDNCYWELREEYLVWSKIWEFLEAQFKMYGGHHIKDQELEELSNTKSSSELIEKAKDGISCNFQSDEFYDSLRLSQSKSLDVLYEGIIYLIDGKIMMECYTDILQYFSKLIHMQKNKYEIADCVKAMITG